MQGQAGNICDSYSATFIKLAYCMMIFSYVPEPSVSNRSNASRISCFCSSVSSNFLLFDAAFLVACLSYCKCIYLLNNQFHLKKPESLIIRIYGVIFYFLRQSKAAFLLTIFRIRMCTRIKSIWRNWWIESWWTNSRVYIPREIRRR